MTDRLELRPATVADAGFLAAIEQVPAARVHLLPGQATPERAEAWAVSSENHWRAGSDRHFGYVVHLRDGRGPVGTVSLTVTHPARRIAQIGWGFDLAHAGLGYATEAAGAVVHLAFGARQLRALRADCYADNLASRRVMVKLGMRLARTPASALALWWSYPDTRPKVRHVLTRRRWRALLAETPAPSSP